MSSRDSTLRYCLFRAVELTKNADRDKYYFGGMVSDSIHDHLF